MYNFIYKNFSFIKTFFFITKTKKILIRIDEKILDYINAMEDKELRKDITDGQVKINDCF